MAGGGTCLGLGSCGVRSSNPCSGFSRRAARDLFPAVQCIGKGSDIRHRLAQQAPAAVSRKAPALPGKTLGFSKSAHRHSLPPLEQGFRAFSSPPTATFSVYVFGLVRALARLRPPYPRLPSGWSEPDTSTAPYIPLLIFLLPLRIPSVLSPRGARLTPTQHGKLVPETPRPSSQSRLLTWHLSSVLGHIEATQR